MKLRQNENTFRDFSDFNLIGSLVATLHLATTLHTIFLWKWLLFTAFGARARPNKIFKLRISGLKSSPKKYLNGYVGASLPPRQPKQLPWLIFETTIINHVQEMAQTAWQIWRKEISLFFYQAKSLNILFYRIENIIIILSCKKSS